METALSTNVQYQYKEYWPAYNEFNRTIVKVDLYYLDGTTNQIKMTLPHNTKGGLEELNKYLTAYVCELSKYFIKISHYQITMGAQTKDGQEHWIYLYHKKEIPLNACYVVNWPLGAWVDPVEVKRKRQEIMQERINKGEHPDFGNFPFPYNEG